MCIVHAWSFVYTDSLGIHFNLNQIANKWDNTIDECNLRGKSQLHSDCTADRYLHQNSSQ